ncbi:MAG: hypothetical protein ABS36_17460 [Acidobacteria bacterium SCN 69-37]|mgnify:CR=1 FL=1|nr:MAG: hypothetical protein ABS36_17460 [Acidobacteria bacterium SCN 69-37]
MGTRQSLNPESEPDPPGRWRTVLFAIVALACAVVIAWSVSRVVRQGATPASADPAEALDGSGPPAGDGSARLLFLQQAGEAGDGRLVWAPLDAPAASGISTPLTCERVDMAEGVGVCLARRRRFPVSYAAVIFDGRFQVRAELPLPGVPSRTQVSPSGRYAGVTVFVSGHSYAAGNFSTRTSIIDLQAGRWLVEDLETLTVRQGAESVQSVDFNFWGVTFAADDQRFFATLGTGGRTYLVRGVPGGPVLEIVAADVECPSLSPDGRRVAYKHRTAQSMGAAFWQIWVLDLETGDRHALAEPGNVDDQVQWIDDATVMYAMPGDRSGVMDTWAVPADGSGQPTLLRAGAYSAFVMR